MLRSMSGQQLAEWIEYSQIEPFGEERDDLRMGILASALINNLGMMWTGENPGTKPADFIPDFEQKEADPVDVAAKVDMYFSMMAMAAPTPNPSPNDGIAP